VCAARGRGHRCAAGQAGAHGSGSEVGWRTERSGD
jgi:hypothetical protein